MQRQMMLTAFALEATNGAIGDRATIASATR